jgi:hypothetical protein
VKTDTYNGKPGFYFLECADCQKVTTHYKGHGNNDVLHCTSKQHPGYTAPIAEGTIQMGSMNNKPHMEAPTEGELRRLNRMDRTLWRSAEERKHRVYAPQDISDQFNQIAEKHMVGLTCKFCNAPVDEITKISEKKATIRKYTDSYRDEFSGEIVMTEKVTSRLEEIHACKNCSLKIQKPIHVRRV